MPPVVTNNGVNQHAGTLSVTMTVGESYQRAGVGLFQSVDGTIGQVLENGSTSFNVGLNLQSSVGASGQWQLDLSSLTSGFLSYSLSEVVTTRVWSEASEPYTSFNGTDTTHDRVEETRSSSSTRVTSAAGGTTGSSTQGEITNAIQDSTRIGTGNYTREEYGVTITGTGSVDTHYNETTNLNSSVTYDLNGALVSEFGFGIYSVTDSNDWEVLGSGSLIATETVVTPILNAKQELSGLGQIGSDSLTTTYTRSIDEGESDHYFSLNTTTYAMREGLLTPITKQSDGDVRHTTLADLKFQTETDGSGSMSDSGEGWSISGNWTTSSLSKNDGRSSTDVTIWSSVIVDLITGARTPIDSGSISIVSLVTSTRDDSDVERENENTTDGNVEKSESTETSRASSSDTYDVTVTVNAQGDATYTGAGMFGTSDSSSSSTSSTTLNGENVGDGSDDTESPPAEHNEYNIPAGVDPEESPDFCTPDSNGGYGPYTWHARRRHPT